MAKNCKEQTGQREGSIVLYLNMEFRNMENEHDIAVRDIVSE